VDVVYGYVYARLGRPAAVELLTEQVFVHAWHHLRGGGWSGQTVLPGLLGQVDTMVADRHQRQAPTARAVSGLLGYQATRPLSAGLGERLTRALGELSPDQQQVLLLRFGQRLEVDAIAELLGIDAEAVQRLQLRGLQALLPIWAPAGQQGGRIERAPRG
jgi:RNA polymerase sigma-70 factor (ECF subfamily)